MGEAYERWKTRTQQAAPSAPDQERDFLSWRFLGNLGRSAVELPVNIAEGVGALAGAVAHDAILNPAKDLVSVLPGPDLETKSYLAEMARGLPEVAKHYGRTYGSKEGFLSALYEDPASIGLDAFSVASAGGGLAARGAAAAARTSKVADALADLARTGSTTSRTARVVDQILPGAADNAAFLKAGGAAEDAPYLGGTRRAVNPALPPQSQIVERAASMNPTTRVFERIKDRLQTVPTDELRGKLDGLEELISARSASTSQIAEAKNLRAMLDLADETKIDRAFTERVGNKLAGRTAHELLGDYGASVANASDRVGQTIRGHVKTLGREEAQRSHSLLQLGEAESAGRMTVEQIRRFISDPENLTGPRAGKFAEQVPAYLTHLDDIVDELNLVQSEGYVRATHPVSVEAVEGFVNELRSAGRFVDAPPFQRHIDLLTPEEQAVLTQRVTGHLADEAEKSRRFIENLSDAVPGEAAGAAGRVTDFVDDMRLTVDRELGQNWFREREGLADAFDHAYMPLRIMEGLPRKQALVKRLEEAGAPPDEIAAARAMPTEDFARSSIEIDDALRAAGKKPPVYFPHQDVIGTKLSDFLRSLQLRGVRPGTPNVFKKSEGILFERYARGIADAYETDPLKAYTRAAAQVTKAKEAEKFIDRWVRELGRPIASADEVNFAAETVMVLDFAKLQFRKNAQARMQVMENIADGQPLDAAAVRAIEATLTNVPNEVAEIIGKKGAAFAIPKSAASKLTAVSKYSGLFPPGFRLFHDGLNNLWRDQVLYWRPAFYAYNLYGNSVFLGLQGGRPTGVLRQLDKRYREDVEGVIANLGDDLLTNVVGGGFHGIGTRPTHLGAASDTRAGQAAIAAKETKVARAGAKVTATGKFVNQRVIENPFRVESFLRGLENEAQRRGVRLVGNSWWRSKERLEQLQKVGANPKGAKAALDEMNKTMNNYAAQGPIERGITRRLFMPFWAFYKHSARTLIRMPYEHPAKAQLLRWVETVNEEMKRDALGVLPEYTEGALHLGEGQPGFERFLGAKGINPLDAPTGLLNMFTGGPGGEVAAGIAPIPKTLIEYVTGRDLLTGRQFSSPDAMPAFGSDQAYDREGNPVTVRPDLLELLRRQVPAAKLYSDIRSGGRRYTAEDEVITDPLTGEPRYPVDPLQKLLQFLGVSTFDVDVPGHQQRAAQEQQQALVELIRRGMNQ